MIKRTLTIPLAGEPLPMNGAILRRGNGYVFCWRSSARPKAEVSYLKVCRLNNDFQPVTSFKQLSMHDMTAEDPRLIEHGDNIVVVFNNRYRMFYITIDDDFNVIEQAVQLSYPTYLGAALRQKNWSPFIFDNELWFVYSILPHVAIKADGSQTLYGPRHKARINKYFWKYGPPRGGTPAVMVDNRHYLSVFHSSTGRAPRDTYCMGAYLFEAEPPFKPVKATLDRITSPSFYTAPNLVNRKKVVFPVGLYVEKDSVFVSYGDQDSRCNVMEIDRAALFAAMTPL